MMNTNCLCLATAFVLALPLGACDQSADGEFAAVSNELELENGGLTMTDELPMFGEPTLFEDAGLRDDETPVSDAIADDPEVEAMERDGEAHNLLVLWGKFPASREGAGYVWSGTFRVNRGAVLVRRTIRFDRGDELLARDSRLSFSFVSATKPHHDGVVLTILDPDPGSDEPLALTYEPRSGDAIRFDVAALHNGRQAVDVDGDGNKMIAVANRPQTDACDNGFIRGRWHKVGDDRGRLYGVVANADGEAIGHMKGVWGVRLNRRQVFFGKYINLDGEFKGLFAGRYRGGHFAGRWIHRAGERGVLGGGYRLDDAALDNGDIGGQYMGRWAETSCNPNIDPGEPTDETDRESADGINDAN